MAGGTTTLDAARGPKGLVRAHRVWGTAPCTAPHTPVSRIGPSTALSLQTSTIQRLDGDPTTQGTHWLSLSWAQVVTPADGLTRVALGPVCPHAGPQCCCPPQVPPASSLSMSSTKASRRLSVGHSLCLSQKLFLGWAWGMGQVPVLGGAARTQAQSQPRQLSKALSQREKGWGRQQSSL